MKATGIVRRIDDLGRVVVPKEIRRTLRIREGDPLEIYTDREGGIVLRKYSPIGELSQRSAHCCGWCRKKGSGPEGDQPAVGYIDEPARKPVGCQRRTEVYSHHRGWRRKLYSTGHLSDYRRGGCHWHCYSDDKR